MKPSDKDDLKNNPSKKVVDSVSNQKSVNKAPQAQTASTTAPAKVPPLDNASDDAAHDGNVRPDEAGRLEKKSRPRKPLR